MTARQAAAAVGVSERTVRRAIQDGRLPATKAQGRFCIELAHAQAVFARRQVGNRYQAACAEALHLLRAFCHEADAREIELRHGLVYVEPAPKVYAA